MPHEIEIKFLDVNIPELREILQANAADFQAGYFERNIAFDTPERTLYHKRMLLRLRQKGEAVLTLKRPPTEPVPQDLKVWDETETKVADFDAMRTIILGLGYFEAFQYEKIREKWRLDGCAICLDTLPFGDYLEVEGEEEALRACLKKLNLDIRNGSKKTYYELNREHRAAHGLPEKESFVFDDPRAAAEEAGVSY